jgi:hypothetical protein
VSAPGLAIVQARSLRGHRPVRLGLCAQVDAEDVVAVRRALRAHGAHDQIAVHSGRVRRLDKLDRAVTVHRQLAGAAAAGAGAGGEHHCVRPRDRLRDLGRPGYLEIAQDRLAAVGPEVIGMCGVPDQPAHPVAARHQQPRQAPRDLSVSTGDRNVHRG